MEVDKLQQKLTEKFRFQVVAFLCLGAIYGRGAWNVFAAIFLAGSTGHSCNISTEIDLQNITNGDNLFALSHISNNYSFDGMRTKKRSAIRTEECDVTIAVENGTNITKPCIDGWVYHGEFDSTIISEWDLICGQAYLSELSMTIYLVGSMCGALLISPLSDRYGRKLVLIICLFAQAIIGSCVALSQTYAVFTALRFVVGFFNMSIGLSSYVMVTELFPALYRNLACCGLQIFWAGGIMITSLFGFIVRDWRHLQLVISLPNILFLACIWFIPESLPWLISKNRLLDAQTVVNKIAKFNGINDQALDMQYFIHNSGNIENASDSLEQTQFLTVLHHDECKNGKDSDDIDGHDRENVQVTANNIFTNRNSVSCPSSNENHSSTSTDCKNILLLYRSQKLRLYSLILFYLFFVNSLSYFGISLSIPVLHGNQFINLFLLGAVEIPAYILCAFVGERIGRKIPLCIFLFVCGLMNIFAVLSSSKTFLGIQFLSDACVFVSKFAITGAYSTIYLYSAEVFPTSVRNQAMGISSFFENFGSIAAPFIVYSAKSIPELPMILFGAVSIIGGISVTALPETQRQPLPVVIEDIESLDISKKVLND